MPAVTSTHAQARRAANLVPVDVTPEDTARIADAASDVWEPLVRRLFGELVNSRAALARLGGAEWLLSDGDAQIADGIRVTKAALAASGGTQVPAAGHWGVDP